MNNNAKLLFTTAFLAIGNAPTLATELDKSAVEFTAPSEIKWVRNSAGTAEQAVFFGDPSKPGI